MVIVREQQVCSASRRLETKLSCRMEMIVAFFWSNWIHFFLVIGNIGVIFHQTISLPHSVYLALYRYSFLISALCWILFSHHFMILILHNILVILCMDWLWNKSSKIGPYFCGGFIPGFDQTKSAMRKDLIISILLFIVGTSTLANLSTEEEALAFITQEENRTEEIVKELIVKVIWVFVWW